MYYVGNDAQSVHTQTLSTASDTQTREDVCCPEMSTDPPPSSTGLKNIATQVQTIDPVHSNVSSTLRIFESQTQGRG